MILRQSTSQVFRIGPFLDSTDGVTPEAGLSIANTDVDISKDGAAFAPKNSGGLTADGTKGWYSGTWDATDTGTVGEFYAEVTVSGALPVWVRYWVIEEAVYDQLYAAVALAAASPGSIATIDSKVDAILIDTAVIGVGGAGLDDLGGMSTAMKAEVKAEADASIVTHGLDHLVSAAVADEVVDDSIIAKMVDRSSTADWSSYVHEEDSLRALSEGISAIGSASGGGFNFAPDGSNFLEDQIDDAAPAVDKGTSPETVGIPVTGHAFLAGHEVTLSGTDNYEASFVIDSVSVNEVVIVATYAAETFSSSDNIDSSIKGTVLEGVETTNTFAAASGNDGVYHVIDDDGGNNFTIAYRYDIEADRIATEAVFTGYLSGGNDNALIQAYDFVNSVWETRELLDGQAGTVNQTVTIKLLARNTGTVGNDLGMVLLRISDGASSSNPTLNVDSLLVEGVGTGQRTGYALGRIWLDTIGGTDGEILNTHGTADRPCKTYANVVALVAAGRAADVHVLNGSTVTLDAGAVNYSFFGNNWSLLLGGQLITGMHAEGAEVSGLSTGTGATFAVCDIGTATIHDASHFNFCEFSGTFTFGSAGDYVMANCLAHIVGGVAPTFAFGAVGNVVVNFRGYDGGIITTDMSSGDVMGVQLNAGTVITLGGADATVAIAGPLATLNNNLTGSPNVVTNGLYGLDLINAEVDTALTDIHLDHLMAVAAADVVADGSVIAHMASATEDWSTFVPSTDALQALRDHIGDGTNLSETGGDGDHLTAINLPNQTMDITGNVSGSVGSVSGAVGSVAGNVDGNVSGSVASNLELGPSEVNAEVDTALTDIHLDHLMATAAADVVADGSVIAHMVSDSEDWSTFVPSTDSLEAIRDRGDAITAGGPTKAEMDTAHALLATVAKQDVIDANVDAVKVITDALTVGAAIKLALSMAGVIVGTTSGTPTTTSCNTDLTGFNDGELVDRQIIFTGSTGDGQGGDISGYISVGGVVTYSAVTTAPGGSTPFIIV